MIAFSLAVISDRLQALTRAMDADPVQPARLRIYSAPVPSSGQPPDTAQLLATLVFPKPSLSSVSVTTLTLLNPATTLVATTGEAAWARIENGAGQYVADLDVGVVGSGAAVILYNGSNSLMLYAGGELSVTLAKLQEP